MSQPATGRLLVATPNLEEPNFRRTVILLCAHSEEGTFGLVLNRPLPERVADHVPEWGEFVTEPPVLFRGGPVEQGAVFAIAAGDDLPVDRWGLRVVPGLGLIDPAKGPAAFEGRLARTRFFVGYAGWGGGQLEGEIAAHGWFVVDADLGDPFHEPEALWRDVLRRQRGALARYASHPQTPGLN